MFLLFFDIFVFRISMCFFLFAFPSLLPYPLAIRVSKEARVRLRCIFAVVMVSDFSFLPRSLGSYCCKEVVRFARVSSVSFLPVVCFHVGVSLSSSSLGTCSSHGRFSRYSFAACLKPAGP